jgi:hypothetical protein
VYIGAQTTPKWGRKPEEENKRSERTALPKKTERKEDEEFYPVIFRIILRRACQTMMCAECHTHKYDPITQEEYYRFYAFFNTTADHGNSTEPSIAVPAPRLLQGHRPLCKTLG